MKKLISFTVLLFSFFITVRAEVDLSSVEYYTLTEDDVYLDGGVIKGTTNRVPYNHIIIPDSLGGERVIEIAAAAFQQKEVLSVILPSSLVRIGSSAFRSNDMLYVDFSKCVHLKEIWDYAFAYNKLESIDISTLVALRNLGIGAFKYNLFEAYNLPTNIQDGFSGWRDVYNGIVEGGGVATDVHWPWHAVIPYTLSSGDVIFEDGVITELVNEENIYDLVIPDTLEGELITRIDSSVFNHRLIETVVFPKGLKSIASSAFSSNCISSLDFSLCDSLTLIESWAFNGANVTKVKFGENSNIKRIEERAFYQNNIEEVDFHNLSKLEHIGLLAFNGSKLKSISFNGCSNLTEIGISAFSNNELTDVQFTSCRKLKIIDKSAFAMNSIKTLDFSDCISLEIIKSEAFVENSLNAVNISGCSKLASIGANVFNSNAGLSTSGVDLPQPDYNEFSGWLNREGTNLGLSVNIKDFLSPYSANIPYTLKNEDVVVKDGVLNSCSYSFAFTNIYIPDTLDNQEIIEILGEDYWRGGAFSSKRITEIRLPKGIRSIGQSAFKDNFIKHVNLSNYEQLEKIDDNAFAFNLLESVLLDSCKSLAFIGSYAFYCESKDTKVRLPINKEDDSYGWKGSNAGLYNSGDLIDNFRQEYAIRRLYTLTSDDVVVTNGIIQSVTIPSGVSDIVIPDTLDSQFVTGIKDASFSGYGVFCQKGLLTIKLPTGLKHIGDYAFYNNDFQSVDLNCCTNLTYIGKSAFENNNLVSIELDSCLNLSEINQSAFADNELKTVSVLGCENLEKIGTKAFYDNENLLSVILPHSSIAGFTGWSTSSGVEYKAGDSFSDFSTEYLSKIIYTLQDDDVEILDGQLISCITLAYKDIIIPEILDGQQVECIGYRNENQSYAAVFANRGISTVKFPSTLKQIGRDAFKGNSLYRLDLDGCGDLITIGAGSFEDNPLEVLSTIGCDSLTVIGDEAFRSCKLQALDLSMIPNLQYIGSYAFYNNEISDYDFSPCKYLKYIDDNAFYLNDHSTISFNGCENLETIGSNAFGGFSNLTSLSFNSCFSLKTIGNDAFCSGDVATLDFSDCVKLESIGARAFARTEISSLELKNLTHLKAIGNGAFDYSINLRSLAIEGCDSLVSIGSECFANCRIDDLKLDLKSLTTIGSSAFNTVQDDTLDMSLCPNLESIGNYAFSNHSASCIKLDKCNKLLSIGYRTFNSSDSKGARIIIPESAYEGFQYWKSELGELLYEGDEVIDLESAYKVKAYYTLTDDDVIVKNGDIISCSYSFSLTDIIIPEWLDGQQINSIGERAGSNVFKSKGITSLVLPASLQKVGKEAFRENSIDSLDLSRCDSQLAVGNLAFYNSNIAHITISDFGLSEIGISAFANNSIDSLDLSACDSLEIIENGAFKGNEIYFLILPQSGNLKRIKNEAFSGNNIKHIDFSNAQGLLELGNSVFKSNSIDSLNLSYCENLEVISDGAFAYNTSLVYVNLGTMLNLIELEDNVFYSGKVKQLDLSNCISLERVSSHLIYSYYVDDQVLILPRKTGNNVIGWQTYYGIMYACGDSVSGDDTEQSFTLRQWYTLQDDDVTVKDGNIVSCNYDFFFKDIIIPDTLDQQEITGVKITSMTSNESFQYKGIKSIVFPSSIKYLGDRSFSYNELLSLDFSACDSLSFIGQSCFSSNAIETLLFPDHCLIETFESSVFAYNNISTLNLLKFSNLKSIRNSAFNNNSIDSLNFSHCEDLEEIDDYAFSNNRLTSLDFSQNEKLVEIGNSAFYYHQLDTLDISSCFALARIGANAFYTSSNNESLSFTLPVSNYPHVISWLDVSGNSYNQGDTLIYSELVGELYLRAYYELTDEDVVVENGFIKSCSYNYTFKDIIIPDTLDAQAVIGIENHLLNPYPIFSSRSLLSIQLPTTLRKIGDDAFYANKLTALDLSDCPDLQYIGENAFSYNDIDSVVLNDLNSLMFIGASAFAGNNIASYVLPENTDYSVLNWIDKADSIYSAGDSIINMYGEYHLPIEYTLTDEDVVVEDGNLISCSYSFVAMHIIIPKILDSQVVTAIMGEGASVYSSDFYNRHLKQVDLPVSLKEIGNTAFSSNDIKEFSLSDLTNLERIGANAFSGNNIASINFSSADNLLRIEDNAFAGNKLDTVDLTNSHSLEYIGAYAFYTNKIEELNLRGCDSLKTIGAYAFYDNQLDSINLSECNYLKDIGNNAFNENKITSFQLPINENYKDLGWKDSYENTLLGGTYVSNFSSYYQVPITYTLRDEDVVVENGKIVACSYNFELSRIIIPDTLDGQLIISIAGYNVDSAPFSNKGIVSVLLPSGLQSLEKQSFAYNKLRRVNFSVCTDLDSIAEYAFYDNSLIWVDLTSNVRLKHMGYSALGSYYNLLIMPGNMYTGKALWSSRVYYSMNDYYQIGDIITYNPYCEYDLIFKPQAAFSVNTLIGEMPFVVQFTDTSIYEPTSWFWNFGDGSVSAEENPSHTYSRGGTFTVTHIARNVAGADTVIFKDYIIVDDILPEGKISANTYEGYAPCEIIFTDASRNYPTSWYWDFGDNTSSTEQNPKHTYEKPGVYSLMLIVGNTAGFDTMIVADRVMITTAPPVAKFSSDSIKGYAPLQINFTDQSQNSPTSWLWSFGDGSTSTEQHPNHTYAQTGTYTISLKVCNVTGCDSLVMVDYIIIEDKNAGINDNTMENIKIYPNPVITALTIKVENMKQLQLIDMSGNEIIQKEISNQSIQLDMSAFHPGIYFLILENEDGRIVQKVVKE